MAHLALYEISMVIAIFKYARFSQDVFFKALFKSVTGSKKKTLPVGEEFFNLKQTTLKCEIVLAQKLPCLHQKGYLCNPLQFILIPPFHNVQNRVLVQY